MNDKTQNRILVGFVGLILLIAILIFGFGKNEWGHTGFEVIFNQGAWFIISMLLFFFAAVVAGYFAWNIYQRTQTFFSRPLALTILAIIFFAISFGKGCDVKGSDGVTGPKGRPVAVLQ